MPGLLPELEGFATDVTAAEAIRARVIEDIRAASQGDAERFAASTCDQWPALWASADACAQAYEAILREPRADWWIGRSSKTLAELATEVRSRRSAGRDTKPLV
jgi:hypothetical protein